MGAGWVDVNMHHQPKWGEHLDDLWKLGEWADAFDGLAWTHKGPNRNEWAFHIDNQRADELIPQTYGRVSAGKKRAWLNKRGNVVIHHDGEALIVRQYPTGEAWRRGTMTLIEEILNERAEAHRQSGRAKDVGGYHRPGALLSE